MAQSSSRCYCSVPFCSNNKQNFPYLSFHDFPVDPDSRAHWVRAIRREEGPRFRIHRGSSFVCRLHFGPEDTYVTASGRVRIKKGAVPSRFHWNNWDKEPGGPGFTWPSTVLEDSHELPVSEDCAEETPPAGGALTDHDYAHPPPPEPGGPGFTWPSTVLDDSHELPVSEDCEEATPPAGGALTDHDYAHPPPPEPGGPGFTWPSTVLDDSHELPVSEDCEEATPPAGGALTDHDYTHPPPPGNLDDAIRKIKDLVTDIQQLTLEKQQPLVYKFCITDEDFYYYTRFPSAEVFTLFWESIQPSASKFVEWSKAQRMTQETARPQRQLAPIDEFFMFLCRVGAGLEEKTLSAIFEVSLSTVTHTILTWTSYLYQVLGSLPTWMSKQQVQATMPEKLKLCCPELRVIIDCTEISCETASSLSKHKDHTTFKGLIGIAPCGLITFISKLYKGSISDQEITKTSKLLQLLQPGDGVMADERFLIEKMVEDVGATLIIPPLNNSPHRSWEDTQKSQAVGRLRALAERVIHRVKEYHVWDGPVPLYMTGSVNQLWVVCCAVSNYQGPLDIRGDRPV